MTTLLLWRGLAAVAAVGLASSTVFLAMALLAALRNRRINQRMASEVAALPAGRLPMVTVLKPLYGLEPRLEENLASFFAQDYPAHEILFGFRTPQDPAVEVVERLRARFPQVSSRIVYSGQPQWPSAKVWSLEHMIREARSQFLVISDSDILVGPDFLRNVVAPLLCPENGLVTCLYRGVPAGDFWSGLEALGMSVEMPSGVMTADMLEGMCFALGPVMAVRTDALEAIGGIRACAEYYSDDFVLGNRVAASGFHVVLSHYRVAHVLCAQSATSTFRTQLRWMQSTRYSRPKGHLGTGLTFSVPFGLLAWASLAALGWPALGASLALWSVVNRVVQSVAIGYLAIGDRRALTHCLLYPLRDLLGFGLWLASYCGGSSFRWRGELYRFTAGGRIVNVLRRSAACPD